MIKKIFLVIKTKPETWWVYHWHPVELARPPWAHPKQKKNANLDAKQMINWWNHWWSRTQMCAFDERVLYLLVILVKVLAVLQKGLHIAQQLPSKVGLQGQQLILDLGAPRQQLLPGVAHSIDFIGLLFCHRKLVFVEHGVGLLWEVS